MITEEKTNGSQKTQQSTEETFFLFRVNQCNLCNSYSIRVTPPAFSL